MLIRIIVPVLLTPLATAQEPVKLFLEGESIPGIGLVEDIDNVAVNGSGEWLVEVDTTAADTGTDTVLFKNGVQLLREGDALPAPAGVTLNQFDALELESAGDLTFNLTFTGGGSTTSDDSGVYFNSNLVLREGTLASAAGFSPGTTYGSFSHLQSNGAGDILVVGLCDDPTVTGTTDFYAAVLATDGAGNLTGETLIALEGQDPPGAGSLVINTVRTGSHASAINASGDVIWCADLDTGSPPNDAVVYLNNTLLAQEGMASPVAGRTWGNLVSPEVDLNNAGDYTLKDRLDSSDSSTDDIIIKNGAKFMQAGDTLPAISPFTFEYFGNGPAALTENGDVLWFGRWDDPDSDRDEGLFLNDQLIIQEGVTTVGGVTVVDVGDQSENYAISPNGQYVIAELELDDGSFGAVGAFLLQIAIGETYCDPAVPNSSGNSGEIAAAGSSLVVDNDFSLVATGLALNRFGYFLASKAQASIMNPGGSQGTLCLGQPLGRFASLIANSGPEGRLEIDVDLSNIPLLGAVLPGETWNFQCWFRDVNPNNTSNFTNGVSVLFN